MKKVLFIACILLLHYSFSISQIIKVNQPGFVYKDDTIPPKISWNIDKDGVHFSAKLRPLRQLAGAPSCFYGYFWEFGDGTFSYEESPMHIYKDTGTYQVRLYAINYHDDGIAPPSKPYTIRINNKVTAKSENNSIFFEKENQVIKIEKNAEPKPGENFVAVVGYRNKQANAFSGSIVFLYNEKEFNNDGFELAEQRSYYGEKSSSFKELWTSLDNNNIKLTNNVSELADENNLNSINAPKFSLTAQSGLTTENLYNKSFYDYDYNKASADYKFKAKTLFTSMKDKYTEDTVFRFKDLLPGDEHFMFLTFKSLPTLIQDTNTTVTISAMFIPDDPFMKPEVFNLNMEIVASHDPNNLLLKKNHFGYRFLTKKKEINYVLQFQNVGKGPAKRVAVGFSMPKQLNASSLQLRDIKPYCSWCDSLANKNQSCIDTIRTADSIFFVLNNIYLPGVQQHLVKNMDSTKGYLDYSIRFKTKPKKKIPFTARASIVFDKNPPIRTNRAIVRFAKGFSLGIMAGYNLSPANEGYTGNGPIQIGFTLSPYAPTRPYLQFEFHGGFLQNAYVPSVTTNRFGKYDTTVNLFVDSLQKKTSTVQNLLKIVPLHFRYNINEWIGVGIGVLAQLPISEKVKHESNLYAYDFLFNQIRRDTLVTQTSEENRSFSDLWKESSIGTFIDLQVGKVRTGPTLGIRYTRQWNNNLPNQFFMYAALKL